MNVKNVRPGITEISGQEMLIIEDQVCGGYGFGVLLALGITGTTTALLLKEFLEGAGVLRTANRFGQATNYYSQVTLTALSRIIRDSYGGLANYSGRRWNALVAAFIDGDSAYRFNLPTTAQGIAIGYGDGTFDDPAHQPNYPV